ncbi:excalibur calcium-binding domain-containing protein [Nonomuraea sp. NPDC050556]|uniref:excalibur calcium-binding domain-containing protein n=1 Tax=Nonomuraea sp. NPDC050556 TaxID=3364369 RepID=UPI0037B4E6B0
MVQQPPPGETPRQEPEADEKPQASRVTTVVLLASLVVVVLVAGVLGTLAVLMTRNQGTPLFGAVPPKHLATPIHFAPVAETKPAPCPGVKAALDELQKTCYVLDPGVTVTAVQKIEPLRESDGTYSVRIAIAPAFRDKVASLTKESVGQTRQIAVVSGVTVLAAPIVTQAMSGDSLSISGFTKEEADMLAARLLGPEAAATPSISPTTPPVTDQPTAPVTTGGTAPVGGATPTRTPDQKYASCKEAVAAGAGPYTKGVHPEYSWYTDLDNNGVACNSADVR